MSAGADVAQHPLAGRHFHMLGVGGAGVSALAQLCSAWGAQVDGCDPAGSAYLDIVRARGIDAALGHDAAHVDAGVAAAAAAGGELEVVASSAVPADHPELVRARELGCRVRLRGELLGELTQLRTSVVVAGAHGKSTTTGMLAHVCTRCDLDPALALGAMLPGAARGAGAGPGASNVLVGAGPFLVEGDESDRTLLELGAHVAVVTNIERDHHHTFVSDAEVEALFATWVGSLAASSVLVAGPGPALDRLVTSAPGRVVRFGQDDTEVERVQRALTAPGRHNALNALAAMAAAAELGIEPVVALAELGSFGGIGRRWQHVGEARGVTVVDDYAHHPTEVAAAIDAGRAARGGARARGETAGSGRVLVAFQPHLYSRTAALWREFAEALSTSDGAWVLPIYGAREQPAPGVTRDLIADELRRIAPERLLGTPDIEAATGDVATILDGVMEGDTVITMGAGDVTRLGPRIVAGLDAGAGGAGDDARPPFIERDVALHRFTTIGTGGSARWFAKVEHRHELEVALAWAAAEGLPVATMGLGSNSLIDDAGFDGLAIRLAGELSAIDVDPGTHRVVLGGGASLAAAVRRCRDAGLAGFEFACAIPGTAGGALKMNAGAYGGEMADVLVRATLVGATGSREVLPGDLDMRYRHTNIGWDEVVAEVEVALRPGDPDEIKALVKDMQSRRSDSQPRAARSFGSVFQNPAEAPPGGGPLLGAGALIEAAGLKGHQVGGARISPKHGNFIENVDGASTADIVALIELARAQVLEQFSVELHTEVHLLSQGGYRPLHDGQWDHAG